MLLMHQIVGTVRKLTGREDDMHNDLQSDLREIKDRLRRTETRVTKWLESQGFETNVRKPLWINGKIKVPTKGCSIVDCMEVVPPDWPSDQPINVYVHEDYLMTFYLTPED